MPVISPALRRVGGAPTRPGAPATAAGARVPPPARGARTDRRSRKGRCQASSGAAWAVQPRRSAIETALAAFLPSRASSADTTRSPVRGRPQARRSSHKRRTRHRPAHPPADAATDTSRRTSAHLDAGQSDPRRKRTAARTPACSRPSLRPVPLRPRRLMPTPTRQPLHRVLEAPLPGPAPRPNAVAAARA